MKAHQAMLEPLSPKLSTMFQQHNCCNCSGSYCGRREAIQVHLPDIHVETMKCLLHVIYSGKAYLRKHQAEDIEGLMNLLDMKLPGEFKNEECALQPNPVIDTPSSSISSKKRKPSESPNKNYVHNTEKSASKAPRMEEKSHEKLLIEMAQRLMPFEENKVLDCNFPGCPETVSHHSMTSHFQQHFDEVKLKQNEQQKMEVIMFKCLWCPKEFKFRRALDHHKKTFHNTEDQSKKKQATKSAEDLTLPMKNMDMEENTSSHVCQYCKQKTKSEWHLAPYRHKCPLLPMIEASKLARLEVQSNNTASSEGVTCNKCGKTLESSWHMSPSRHNCTIKIKQETIDEGVNESINCEMCGITLKSKWHLTRHSCMDAKATVGSEISVYDCRICVSVFEDFSHLCSHYTREHYWDKLVEEFSPSGRRCSICLLEFESNEDLVYHMGNVHRRFNKYMKEDGHGSLHIMSKFKLKNLKCGVGNCTKEADNATLLRMHLCTSHFSKYLSREFTNNASPCFKSCPPSFVNEAKRLYHIGCFHNEVYKFAAFHYTDPEAEQTLATLFDLTELRKGKHIQQSSDEIIKKNRRYVQAQGPISYTCAKCKKEYTTRTRLKIHIAFSHYREKLMKTYTGTTCGICERKTETNKLLIKHVAFKHDTVIAYLLGKEGLTLPRKIVKEQPTSAPTEATKDKTNDEEDAEDSDVKESAEDADDKTEEEVSQVMNTPLSDTRKKAQNAFHTGHCQICLRNYSTPVNLKVHYVSTHYFEKFTKGESETPTRCPICSSEIDVTTKSLRNTLQLHLASNHAEILIQYMKEDNLWIGNSKIFSEGENGYQVKKLRIDIKMTKETKEKGLIIKAKKLKREEKKKKKMGYFETQPITSPEREVSVSPEKTNEPKLSIEELMTCFLCKKDFNHAGQNALLSHFSEEHYRLELEHNYITRPGRTWRTDKRCPTCFKIVEAKEDFVLHIGVEHRAVEAFLPEKYKLPNVVDQEPNFPCPLPNCSSDKETKKALLVHLLIVHYQKDMEKEFGPLFHKEGQKKCPKCNMALLDNYLGYMKHIAVEHAYVMNFVERDINGTQIQKDSTGKISVPEKDDEKKSKEDDCMKGNDLLSVLDSALISKSKPSISEGIS